MRPATWPRSQPEAERLLVIEPEGAGFVDRVLGELPELLGAGDLLVVNDAATLPAALDGVTEAGARFEARLAELHGSRARAVVFGAGSWRTPTELRAPPPRFEPGELVHFGRLAARIERVENERLVGFDFEAQGAALYRGLYAEGRPIQYSYLVGALSLWHVQSRFASRPWAFEMPSAGRPLSFGVLSQLLRRGVKLASLTHSAGLSSTGSEVVDAGLPWPERYEIPPRTAALVEQASRVIAAGTSVVRALEASALLHGRVRAGSGIAELKLTGGQPLSVVDGLLTGAHDPGTSHFELLESFAPRARLEAAHAHAERSGYLGHELGDSWLLLPRPARRAEAA